MVGSALTEMCFFRRLFSLAPCSRGLSRKKKLKKRQKKKGKLANKEGVEGDDRQKSDDR